MTLRQISSAVIVMTLCAIVLVSSPAQQPSGQVSDISFNDDDRTATIECKGGPLTVNGDDNTLTLKDDCSRLTVNGDDNTINARTVTEITVSGDDNKIVVEAVAKVTTNGDDNNITWTKGVGGKAPEISNKGDDNTTRQAR